MHDKSPLNQQILSANTATDSLPKSQPPVLQTTIFGLPRFEWSLALLGLCIFTFTIVTYIVNMATVGVAIGVLGLFFTRNKLRLPFLVWSYAAFLLWTFLASFASAYPEIAREQLIESLKLLVIMIVAVNALRTAGQLRIFLILLLGCFILFPVRGALVNFFIGGYNVFGRALWNYIYANPNDLAALCLLALGIAIAIRMSTPSRNMVRFGAGIAAVLLLLVILMTQSRGAFLGLAVFLSALLIHSIKRSLRMAISLTIVMFVVAVSVPEGVWDRLFGIRFIASTSTLHEADWEGSATQRFEIQKVAWKIFVDHKVFGVGLGAYKSVNASYAPHLGAKDTHNTYLNLAAELGLPGLMIWCALICSVMLYAHRMQRRADNKELADQLRWIWWGFVAFLVTGIFGTYSHLTFPIIMLAVLWCSGNIITSSESYPTNAEQTKRSRICAG